MAISANTLAAARTYARDMSGAPLPEPPTADAGNGPPARPPPTPLTKTTPRAGAAPPTATRPG